MASKNFIADISGTVCTLGLLLAPPYINNTELVRYMGLSRKPLTEDYYEINATESSAQYENHYILPDHSYRTLEKKAEDLFGPMREATPEEQKSVEDYVKSISVNTGVKFF